VGRNEKARFKFKLERKLSGSQPWIEQACCSLR
jgi:hypothetical protein